MQFMQCLNLESKMSWLENPCETFEYSGDCHGFLKAIDLIINRPHLIDKRLAGAVIEERILTLENNEDETQTLPLPLLENYFEGVYVIKRRLIQKKRDDIHDRVKISWPNLNSVKVIFHSIETPDESYAWRADDNGKLKLYCEVNSPKTWLVNQQSKKLIRWSSETLGDGAHTGSLKLISLDEYTELYQSLKDKYFDTILQIWDSESTNPEKFIHEDLGIATYLLLIWKNEMPKSFVDLGCGNGLLVYLLTKEGIPGGVGLDIRKRKIWNYFREEGTDLRVHTIEAKADKAFEPYEWLIGNHSDELTPWIPIMASLSKSNYFLLPCCFYDLFGKYQRIKQKVSQYRDYLDYIFEIGQNKCGFEVQEDKLRIPSTKRVCFIGKYSEEKNGELAKDFLADLQSRNFVPRESEERVKNCTKISKTVVNTIVTNIVNKLLMSEKVLSENSEKVTKSSSNIEWNSGGKYHLSELPAILDSNLLLELKSECGGLQTLLRNHNHIFIVDKGYVRLRNPAEDSHELGKRKPGKSGFEKYRKTKPCWFYNNHPDGCPAKDCHWIH